MILWLLDIAQVPFFDLNALIIISRATYEICISKNTQFIVNFSHIETLVVWFYSTVRQKGVRCDSHMTVGWQGEHRGHAAHLFL